MVVSCSWSNHFVLLAFFEEVILSLRLRLFGHLCDRSCILPDQPTNNWTYSASTEHFTNCWVPSVLVKCRIDIIISVFLGHKLNPMATVDDRVNYLFLFLTPLHSQHQVKVNALLFLRWPPTFCLLQPPINQYKILCCLCSEAPFAHSKLVQFGSVLHITLDPD